jgi:hypothetical protein
MEELQQALADTLSITKALETLWSDMSKQTASLEERLRFLQAGIERCEILLAPLAPMWAAIQKELNPSFDQSLEP